MFGLRWFFFLGLGICAWGFSSGVVWWMGWGFGLVWSGSGIGSYAVVLKRGILLVLDCVWCEV